MTKRKDIAKATSLLLASLIFPFISGCLTTKASIAYAMEKSLKEHHFLVESLPKPGNCFLIQRKEKLFPFIIVLRVDKVARYDDEEIRQILGEFPLCGIVMIIDQDCARKFAFENGRLKDGVFYFYRENVKILQKADSLEGLKVNKQKQTGRT